MGGLRFISSHLCRSLLKQGFNMRIFDKLYGSNHLVRDIEKELDIREGDISRPEDVLKALEGMNAPLILSKQR